MRLYLMRHGQAEDPSVDPEQGLTSGGKQEIENIARKLAQKSLHLSQIYHSSKKRAQQTAQILSGIVAASNPPQYMDNLKPNDNPEIIIEAINQWTDDTMIVGHLPFIPSLLNRLTQTQHSIHFKPGTIACLVHTGNQWQLEWILEP